MTNNQKKLIDDMSYYDMVKKWRFAQIGDILFSGDVGLYFGDSLIKKGKEFTAIKKSEISKSIGWG